MVKEIEEQFFTEFRTGGIVDAALTIIKNNHDLGIRPQTGETPEPWATYFNGGYKERLKKQEDDFDASVILEPVSPVIEGIRANIEASERVARERYLTSLLIPFKTISDLTYPDRTILVEIQRRKDNLLADIKMWGKAKDKAEAEKQIVAAKSLLETIEADYKRQVDISEQLWNLCSQPIKDKDDYAARLFARFWMLLDVYANRLDALLLEYGIDIMTLQKEAGIWILPYRDISRLQSYCGSLQLARKYIAALPKTEAESPIVSPAPVTLPVPEHSSKDVLTVEEAVQFTGLSKSTIYKLTSKQEIPHFKPGGKLIYFNRQELETWLLQNRVSTTNEISDRAQAYCMRNTKGKQRKSL